MKRPDLSHFLDTGQVRRRGLCVSLLVCLLILTGVVLTVGLAGILRAHESQRRHLEAASSRQGLQEADRRREERERRRHAPAAREQRRGSRSAYRNLSREDALRIARQSFGGKLDEPVWRAARLGAGRRLTQWLDERTAVVEEPNGKRGLATSLLPMATEVSAGKGRPVDLRLARRGRFLEPVRPLVPVRLPDRLGQSVALPSTGVAVSFPGTSRDSRFQVAADKAFYANVSRDTDLLLAPVARGVEASWQLRSPESPVSNVLRLAMRRGDRLQAETASEKEAGQAVGARVVRGEKTVLRVAPPVAVDAQGQQLPARLNVESPDRVRISVDTAGRDVAYPILVDPVIDGYGSSGPTYGSPQDFAPWTWVQTHAAFDSSKSTQLSASVLGRAYGQSPPTNSFGVWLLRAYPWAYMYRVDFRGITHRNDQSYAYLAIFSEVENETEPGVVSDGAAIISNNSSAFENYPLTAVNRYACARDNCGFGSSASPRLPVAANGGNRAQWGIHLGATPANKAEATLSGVVTYQSEDDAPTFDAPRHNVDPSRWLDSTTIRTTVTATDRGLGLRQISSTAPGTTAKVFACSGTRTSRCPATAQTADFDYGTGTMAEGTTNLSATAQDIVGNASLPGAASSAWQVKVDRSAPTASVPGGSLLTGRDRPIPVGSYTLRVRGDDGVDRSGIDSVSYSLTREGESTPTQSGAQDNDGCLSGGCPQALEHEFTISTSGLPAGNYTVKATARDQLGHSASDTFKITVGAQPPQPTPDTATIGAAVLSPQPGVVQASAPPAQASSAFGVATTNDARVNPVRVAADVRYLGSSVARVGVSSSATLNQLSPIKQAFDSQGIEIILVAEANGAGPTAAQARNLGTWARAFGPRPGYANPLRYIEFGNENGDAKNPDKQGPSAGGTYANNYAIAYQAINSSAGNPAVGLLAQADATDISGGLAGAVWLSKMFDAQPCMDAMVGDNGGWVVHPYGMNSWQRKIDAVVNQTRAEGASSSIPLFITEWGVASTSEGRSLSPDNYGWPRTMTFTQAARALHSMVVAVKTRYGSRVQRFILYQHANRKPDPDAPGVQALREYYFGALKSPDYGSQGTGRDKYPYTQQVQYEAPRWRKPATPATPSCPPARVGIVAKRARVSSRGALAIALRCAKGRGRCAGKLTLSRKVRVAVRGSRRTRLKTRTLGVARFSIRSRRSGKVKVKLSSSARRLLAGAKRGRLRTRATAKSGGNTARGKITLIRRGSTRRR